jgi:hypothetical protein
VKLSWAVGNRAPGCSLTLACEIGFSPPCFDGHAVAVGAPRSNVTTFVLVLLKATSSLMYHPDLCSSKAQIVHGAPLFFLQIFYKDFK